METGGLAPERALQRLQQLAREERAAVAVGDLDLLCRITRLLSAATERIDRAMLRDMPDAPAIIAEIQAAHAVAETFLAARMKTVSDRLKRYALTRRTVRGYVRTARAGVRTSRLDDLG